MPPRSKDFSELLDLLGKIHEISNENSQKVQEIRERVIRVEGSVESIENEVLPRGNRDGISARVSRLEDKLDTLESAHDDSVTRTWQLRVALVSGPVMAAIVSAIIAWLMKGK